MLTHNTHYPSSKKFIIRYFRDSGIFYLTSNRRLTRYQSSAKKFDSIEEANSFAPFDLSSGLADVVQSYEMGV